MMTKDNQPKSPPPSFFDRQQNVQYVKDSFGNYTGSDGSRVIRDSNGNVIVVPGGPVFKPAGRR
jgi:hypothetical protein